MFLRSCLAALTLSISARGDLFEQFVAAPRDCTPCVWFQATYAGGAPAPAGHSGVLSLGSHPFGSSLYGGWLTFTPAGTFLTYVGAGSAHEILAPDGAPLDDVRGAIKLGEAYGVIVDTSTGAIVAVTLYSGALLWTPGHVYLLLVGGSPTTYEFTDDGAPIADVRGAALLAGQVIDTDGGMGVSATLFSGAVVYTGAQVFQLTTFGLGIGATEVTLDGESLGGVRGLVAMGGAASTLALDAAAFLWTAGRTFLLTSGGPTLVEVLDPSGASIARTWGIVRQSPPYAGGGSFAGAATVITDSKEYFVLSSGGTSAVEVLRPDGTSKATHVVIPPGAPLLRQASALHEVYARWQRVGLASVRGMVIGTQQ